MARRHLPPDPELAAQARDRLVRLLGAEVVGPRRAAAELDDPAGDGEVRGSLTRDAVPSSRSRPVDPDDLEPPRRFTRWHLGVVAAVLVVGLVWGGWSLFRARPEAVAAPALVPTAAATTGVPTASPANAAPRTGTEQQAGSGTGDGPVVHVLGAVRRPGLVRLDPGARVEDALDAAGGLRRDADPDELNLAQPLEDGVQVVVGTREHPAGEVRSVGGSGGGSGGSGGGAGGGGSGGSTGSSGSGSTVDLNRATVDQLDTLPGVGPVTAQRILEWREQHGRFSKPEELQEVDGIGPKTYARIAPHVRV